jgi:lipoprotein-anchoring transpeptidase ErfK/SrfK
LSEDGKLDKEVWSVLTKDGGDDVLTEYEITGEDLAYDFAEEIPEDYAEKAKMERLSYTSMEEMLAERFHMDVDLLKGLNEGKDFSAAGTKVVVAKVDGKKPEGKVARIEADKATRQLRAYDKDGKLIVAYPATIGSAETPSPSGIHKVNAFAENPVYYYRPDKNLNRARTTNRSISRRAPTTRLAASGSTFRSRLTGSTERRSRTPSTRPRPTAACA